MRACKMQLPCVMVIEKPVEKLHVVAAIVKGCPSSALESHKLHSNGCCLFGRMPVVQKLK